MPFSADSGDTKMYLYILLFVGLIANILMQLVLFSMVHNPLKQKTMQDMTYEHFQKMGFGVLATF